MNRRLICAMLTLVIAGCSPVDDRVPAEAMDFRSPLGIDWDQSGRELGVSRDAREQICKADAAFLSAVFDSEEISVIVSECIDNESFYFEVPRERVPGVFKTYDIYGVFIPNKGVSLVEYTFDEKPLGTSTAEDNASRENHVSMVRQPLVEMYGNPNANGSYYETGLVGFVQHSQQDGPCDLWIVENVAIILCSNRVSVSDGVSASLTFARLDREPGSDYVLRQFNSNDTALPFSWFDNARHQSANESTLVTLLNWLGPESYDSCNDDELKPLDDVWVLPANTEAEVRNRFGSAKGDQLAMKAIEHTWDINDDMISESKRLMYLMKLASSQGSAIADNEIGASLVHCYQGVEQDIPRAIEWLNKAAIAGDEYAKASLARLHLVGEIESDDPTSQALELLKECAEDDGACGAKLRALKRVKQSQ